MDTVTQTRHTEWIGCTPQTHERIASFLNMAFASSMLVADYWNEFVLGNIEDWLKNGLNIRCALNAAIALHHTTDYVASAVGKSASTYRSELLACSTSPFISAFELMGDLADTYKHCELRDPDRPRFDVQTVEINRAAGTRAIGTSAAGAGRRVVLVRQRHGNSTDNATDIEFRVLLDRAKLFWTCPTHGEFMTRGIDV